MPRSPSGASARPSPRVSIKSLELNALHTSQIQDMVHLNGNRSKAPPDERGGNRYVLPNATAPHLDSTLNVNSDPCLEWSLLGRVERDPDEAASGPLQRY